MQSLLAYTNDTNLFLLRKSSWHKVEGRGMNKYEIHEKYGTVGFPETFWIVHIILEFLYTEKVRVGR